VMTGGGQCERFGVNPHPWEKKEKSDVTIQRQTRLITNYTLFTATATG